jgi:hypothetical protein
MKMRIKVALGAVIAVIATGAVGTSAMATDPSKPPPTRTDPVTGTLDGPARAQQNGIELEVRRGTQVADFELKYPPGSYSGLHKHLGIVIANVKSGAVWRCVAPNRLCCNEILQGRVLH